MNCACGEDSCAPNVNRAASSPRGSGIVSSPSLDGGDDGGVWKQLVRSRGTITTDITINITSTPEQIPDAQLQNVEHELTFSITGAASIARLEPLLLGDQWGGKQVTWSPAKTDGGSTGGTDFVWETTVRKKDREVHRKARVLNRLSGAQVLEDKANLALLQRRMTAPTLQSHAVKGAAAVSLWARLQFQQDPQLGGSLGSAPNQDVPSAAPHGAEAVAATGVGRSSAGSDNWWCVKAAGGNGGMDVWVLHEGNWKAVTEKLRHDEEYVIQRYVTRPLLWRGRKFHFRCYAAMTADMSAWLYRTAYILSASRPYSLENSQEAGDDPSGLTDELTHISNLAVNKHTEGHPGQVPCDVPSEYPLLWPGMLAVWKSLVQAAAPFMQHQAALGHFEFLGLDMIADEAGGVWLMEANRLPGLQSSKQNLEEENEVYDKMMLDLIRLAVLPPLLGCPPDPGLFEVATAPGTDARAPSTETWRNVMRFAAFKRACKLRPPSSPA